jgi:hypothetical protein
MNKLSRIMKTALTATILAFLAISLCVSAPAPVVSAEALITGKTRFVPITVGDMMISQTNIVNNSDCCNGVYFPDGTQSGGSITFPMPEDYLFNTPLTLDLFFIPVTAGTGNVGFFVRWVGLSEGSWSGTGSSAMSTPVPAGSLNYVRRQSFTLPAIGSPMPQLMELTIRRDTDTYAGDVTLVGLRLMYQSSWSNSYLPVIQNRQ